MGEKDQSFAAMVLPLTRGAIEPAGLRGYGGIEFEARGDGRYALALIRRPGAGRRVELEFQAGPRWRKVRLAFAEKYTELVALQFRLERDASQKAWLELDNLRLAR